MEGKEVKIVDKYIRWFSELGKKDVKQVGGKSANLGEMINAGFPVPQGFTTTAEAYSFFLEETGLKEKIYDMLNKLNVEDTVELEKTAKEIREMVVEAEMPQELKEEIVEAYDSLSVDKEALKNVSKDVMSILKMQDKAFVAVRSSATAEDTKTASFAGQQETFLNVKGNEELIESVKKCFASLFTARSIYYRVKKGFKHEDVLIAVIVQQMINADKSGVIFSRDPLKESEDVVTEAVFGLGEGIVSGRIKPDYYVISRDLEILKKTIADKKIALVRDSAGKTEQVDLTEEKSKQQVLSDYEIKRLADYAIKLEEHYKLPQDIEFAVSSGEIYIVQTRPVTTKPSVAKGKIEGEEILAGLAASPGVGNGEVKVILDLQDLHKIKEGNILVTKMTNPDMVVTMQKSAAIVTDEGGMTAHAAIVSREMGIPAVVGTRKATEILKDGMTITVDGSNGKIYSGKPGELKAGKVEIKPKVETETKIKVIVDLPTFAERASKSGCKEVGLTRLEGIIAESGKHPMFFVKSKEIDKYEEIIFNGINKIAEYFDELWVRTSDIRSDEFRNLEGASKEVEANPMLGMHGIRTGLKYPEILKAELNAMKKIENKKIGILLPQVISLNEVKEVKKIVKEIGAGLKVGVMVETPASVQIIESLCEEGIDFISFGTNDLTQYTLAVDRGNEEVQYLYNEKDPAIFSQLAYVIKVCKKNNVETSICGQAGSDKEMVEFLVKNGIDSISVNADKALEISEFVRDLEGKGLRGGGVVEGNENKNNEKVEEKIESEPGEKLPLQKVAKESGLKPTGEKGYPIKCSDCGKEDKVPFKPKEGRPVYCKECFMKNRDKIKEERQHFTKRQAKNSELKPTEEETKKVEEKIEPEPGGAKEESKETETVDTEEKPAEKKKEEKPTEEKQEKSGVDFGFDIFGSKNEEEVTESTDKEVDLKDEEEVKELLEEAEEEKYTGEGGEGGGEDILDIF